jgi:glycosyltransferase involved in cell wall biosynthesis
MQDTGSKGQHFSKRPLPTWHSCTDRTKPGRAGLVSVIIPAFNDAATVERTISSVRNQTYSDLEVLVVDDGSTDETAARVQRLGDIDNRITLLRKPNGGLVSARNHGIAHATGEFIAPLDADDIWHPDKIEKQMRVMRDRGDGVGLVYCWSRAMDEQDRVLWDITPCNLRGSVYAALITRNFLSSGAPLVRKCCAEAVGGYDATLGSRGASCCEDMKFNLDVAERCDFDLVPEFLLSYRVRAGRMSTNIEAMLRSGKVVIEQARARHPELPDQLFRWASAHQNQEFGLARLSEGRFLSGVRLLLTALREDPFATLRTGTIRAFARVRVSSGFGDLARAKLHNSNGGRVLGRKFLEVDPTAFCGRPRETWSRRRLAYITKLRVVRCAAVRTTASA